MESTLGLKGPKIFLSDRLSRCAVRSPLTDPRSDLAMNLQTGHSAVTGQEQQEAGIDGVPTNAPAQPPGVSQPE